MAWTVDGLSYTTRKKLTIDQTKIDTANLTDFPCLVKLTTTNFDFSHANADGFDIRFTQSDGSTLLKYERERHDGANYAEYWVKIPTVSYTTNTDFYMYYRTTDTADGADPTNVWDDNYVAVYHLKDITTSTVADSTGVNTGDKTAANAPIEIDGQIAKGQDFDGSDDFIACGTDASLNIRDDITIEAWAYQHSAFTGEGVCAKRVGADGNWQISAQATSSNCFAVDMLFPVSSWVTAYTAGSLSINTWYYVVATYDNSNIQMYLNGVPSGSAVAENETMTSAAAANLNIGRTYSNTYCFDGLIDEFRLSNIKRLPEWIKASYNSGANTLLNYGDEEEYTTNFKLNVGDTWKEVSSAKLNIGDTWKTVTSAKINIGDTWKTIF